MGTLAKVLDMTGNEYTSSKEYEVIQGWAKQTNDSYFIFSN